MGTSELIRMKTEVNMEVNMEVKATDRGEWLVVPRYMVSGHKTRMFKGS